MAGRDPGYRRAPQIAAVLAAALVVIAAVLIWALLLAPPPAVAPGASPTAAGMES
jgi:hypothetical protein